MSEAEAKLKAALVRKEAVVRAYARRIQELETQLQELVRRINGVGTPPTVEIAISNSNLHIEQKIPTLTYGVQSTFGDFK